MQMGYFADTKRSKRLDKYRIRALWACGALLLLLLGLLFVLEPANKAVADAPKPVPVEVVSVAQAPRKILVSRVRIERNALINPSALRLEEFDSALIPLDAFDAASLENLVGTFSKEMIQPNEIITAEMVTAEKPIQPLDIPPDHRAVTIESEDPVLRTGHIRPDDRLDISLVYKDAKGQPAIAPIALFTRVLAIDGVNERGGTNVANTKRTLTVLCTIKEAQKLELARSLGNLSLRLISDVEVVSSIPEDPLPLNEILNIVAPAEVKKPDGVMYFTSTNGQLERYELYGKEWGRAEL